MKSLVSFPQCLEPGGHAIVIFDIRRRTVSDQPLKKRWIELLIYSVVQRGSAFLILEIDVGALKSEKFRSLESFQTPTREERRTGLGSLGYHDINLSARPT